VEINGLEQQIVNMKKSHKSNSNEEDNSRMENRMG